MSYKKGKDDTELLFYGKADPSQYQSFPNQRSYAILWTKTEEF